MSKFVIETGARLHFGLLTVNSSLPRQFGGLGLMIESPGFQISGGRTEGEADVILAPDDVRERIIEHLSAWRRSSECELPPVQIDVLEDIPRHLGLGSGTQLALAIGRVLSELTQAPCDVPTIATRLGRGRRSAIGLHGFSSGGLLVDAGRDDRDSSGQLAVRMDWPNTWPLVLVHKTGATGLSGVGERSAFTRMAGTPEQVTDRLCRLLLMELIPAVRAGQFDAFAGALRSYGKLVGDTFASVQGGCAFHPDSEHIPGMLEELGFLAYAQSSWGPTIAVACRSEASAAALCCELKQRDQQLSCTTVRGSNRGAVVERCNAGTVVDAVSSTGRSH